MYTYVNFWPLTIKRDLVSLSFSAYFYTRLFLAIQLHRITRDRNRMDITRYKTDPPTIFDLIFCLKPLAVLFFFDVSLHDYIFFLLRSLSLYAISICHRSHILHNATHNALQKNHNFYQGHHPRSTFPRPFHLLLLLLRPSA